MSIESRMSSLLSEAASDTFAAKLMDAEVAFLEAVAKVLKAKLGKKLESLEVKRGQTISWLEGVGYTASDIQVDFTVSLHMTGPYDVKLDVGGNNAMNGKFDRSIPYKTGVLTVDAAAAPVLEQFEF